MKPRQIIATVAAFLIAGGASAATVSATGDFLQIPQPLSVTNGTPTSNTNILYFNELQGVTLAADLFTDGGGKIDAGTVVDSHMFYLNRDQSSNGVISRGGTLTFATDILGTMSDTHGTLLVASDFLGAPTNYTNFRNRGLELGGRWADTISYSGKTVTANMLNVTQPGDWVRVVTVAAVPLPASLFLLPLGIGALGVLRRRRKTA